MNNLVQSSNHTTQSQLSELHQLAVKSMVNAYVPYSNFKVGTCILSENGDIFVGCNVENAAYPQGQCAEATAIGQMVVNANYKIKIIVIVGDGNILCTPCGGCRQKIREFILQDGEVYVGNKEKILNKFALEELLPFSFGPENL